MRVQLDFGACGDGLGAGKDRSSTVCGTLELAERNAERELGVADRALALEAKPRRVEIQIVQPNARPIVSVRRDAIEPLTW